MSISAEESSIVPNQALHADDLKNVVTSWVRGSPTICQSEGLNSPLRELNKPPPGLAGGALSG